MYFLHSFRILAGISSCPQAAYWSISSIASSMSETQNSKSSRRFANVCSGDNILLLGDHGFESTDAYWSWSKLAISLGFLCKDPLTLINGPIDDFSLDFCFA